MATIVRRAVFATAFAAVRRTLGRESMRISLILTTVLVLLADIGLARADWLDDAWSPKSTTLHGTPAITVRPDGVSVVLPAATFDAALSERGMTRPDALRAFLDRYSPQCSHVLNLNVAQPNLTVELQIQAATSLEDVPAQSQDEMLAAMETVEIPSSKATGSTATGTKGMSKERHAPIPRITQVFTTLPERFSFSIDYAPETVAHCVVPQDPIS
jgi:hypothetical protein